MGLRDLFIDFIYSFVKNKNYKNNNELIEFINTLRKKISYLKIPDYVDFTKEFIKL